MTSNSKMAGLLRAAGNIKDRWRYFSRARQRPARPLPPGAAPVLESLRAHGYAVVPNFYDADRCAFLRAEIDRIIREQPDVVQRDKLNADLRVFGAERASAAIGEFHDAVFPIAVGEHYGGRELTSFSTLAGFLSARPGNLGSGQGWHRDAFHFQYKAMVYLTDVGPDSGPFQLLDASHRGTKVFFDTIEGGLQRAPNTRLTDMQAQALVAAGPERLKTFTAPAGTMILFDSSTIHRGSPIVSGTRYALTNYYYEPEHVVPVVVEKFAPYARAPG
jgi:hypothetical protein